MYSGSVSENTTHHFHALVYSENKLIIYTKPTLVLCSSVAFLHVQNFRARNT